MFRWFRRLWFAKQPPVLPDGQWVKLCDSVGLIAPVGLGWIWEGSFVPTWTPSRELIVEAESRVESYLRSYPRNRKGESEHDWLRRYSAPLIAANLRNYQRQYAGIQLEDRQALFINFFPHRFGKESTTHFVNVEDGGHAYFQLIYRPEERDFPWFQVNGEA